MVPTDIIHSWCYTERQILTTFSGEKQCNCTVLCYFIFFSTLCTGGVHVLRNVYFFCFLRRRKTSKSNFLLPLGSIIIIIYYYRTPFDVMIIQFSNPFATMQRNCHSTAKDGAVLICGTRGADNKYYVVLRRTYEWVYMACGVRRPNTNYYFVFIQSIETPKIGRKIPTMER